MTNRCLLLLDTTCKTMGDTRQPFVCNLLKFPLAGDNYCFRCGEANTCSEYIRLSGIAKTFIPLLSLQTGEPKQMRPVFCTDMGSPELRQICENYLDDIEKGLSVKDYDNYITEAALVFLYGKDVLQWINMTLE